MWHLLKQPFNISDKPKTWKSSCYGNQKQAMGNKTEYRNISKQWEKWTYCIC